MNRPPVAESNSQAANLRRGLLVLEHLAAEPEGASVTQLSERLELPVASVFRIAQALVDLGYLTRDPQTKQFQITNRFLLMGQPQAGNRGLSECAIGAMRTIRQATGETTQLGCLIDTEIVILEQLLALHPFKYSADLGARCPCYSCAPGKAILAFLPEVECRAVVDRLRFKRFTETTLTSKRALLEHLRQVREQGYAVDRAEGMAGIHCVAAPIVDRHGIPVAAITIAGPASRLPEDEFDMLGDVLREGARQASEEFNR